MSSRILKNRYEYGMIPDISDRRRRRSASPRETSSWRQSRHIGANGSGGAAAAAAAGLSTSTIVGIATLVTVVALAIAFIATSATMFPALLKDIDKLEDKSELCFCDKFDSDVFGLLKPDNHGIEVQFYLGNLTLNGTYLYTVPDKNGTLALLSDIPTSFSDAVFFLYHDLDDTKQAHFDVSLLTTNTSQLFSFPDQSGTLALLGDIPTSFSDAEFFLYHDLDDTKQAHFDVSLLTTNTSQIFSFQDQSGVLALLSDIKTSFSDAEFFLYHPLDAGKQAHFDVSFLSPNTSRVYSYPDLSGTFALTTGNQTLSSKTLLEATITSNTNVVHASHLRTLTTPVDVSLATAPTPGQVLTYNGAIGNWQTPVTSGSFLGTNIVWTGAWSVFPDFVIVNWALTGNSLMATTRWLGGLLTPGNNTIYGAEYDLIWNLTSETFGTLNIQDIDPPNAYDVPWAISTTAGGGRLKSSGSIRFLGGRNITGFGSFQGFLM